MSEFQCMNTRIGELLHAYELGLLEESEKTQFEIHLLECEYCLAQIEKLHDQVAALRSDGGIQGAVATESRGPVTGSWFRKIWVAAWTPATIRFRPIYAIAAATLILAAGYLALKPLTKRDVASVQVVTLSLDRSNSDGLFVQSLKRDGVLSFVIEDSQPDQLFELILLDGNGKVFRHVASFDAVEHGVGRLSFPSELMKPGSYSLKVIPNSGAATDDTLLYHFRVIE